MTNKTNLKEQDLVMFTAEQRYAMKARHANGGERKESDDAMYLCGVVEKVWPIEGLVLVRFPGTTHEYYLDAAWLDLIVRPGEEPKPEPLAFL